MDVHGKCMKIKYTVIIKIIYVIYTRTLTVNNKFGKMLHTYVQSSGKNHMESLLSVEIY